MNEFSILVGGKAGDGIDQAGLIIARILSQLGFRLYIYRDYPSLIRGGHTFSIIRASKKKIAAHTDKVDCILALNQDTIDFHTQRLKDTAFVIYDSDVSKPEKLPAGIRTTGLPFETIVKEEKALPIMRNSCLLGSFCKAAGIEWDVLETVLGKSVSKELGVNLKVARRGYDATGELTAIGRISQKSVSVLTGNEATGLGLIKGGLKAYISYPMTPTSGVLHFLAEVADEFSLKVLHPENEIAVMLSALGFSYCGERVAVGTASGGFCLMTEGFSFAGMAELPVVAVVGQRTAPSTGLPTYTGQTDLHFALNAGQGEFPRFVVAPGDAEEAYLWSAIAMDMAWKFQTPSIVLVDKTVSEGTYSFDLDSVASLGAHSIPGQRAPGPDIWNSEGEYKRYLDTETGISPLAFPGDGRAIVKINSYEHDEFGITTEDAGITKKMQEKRLRKEKYLKEDLGRYKPVRIYGNAGSTTALLCWGSNKGVCSEVAETLGLRMIMPLVLSPFPVEDFREALSGVQRLISVENNATGQLSRLVRSYGFNVDENVLKYDGRPFSLEELMGRIKELRT